MGALTIKFARVVHATGGRLVELPIVWRRTRWLHIENDRLCDEVARLRARLQAANRGDVANRRDRAAPPEPTRLEAAAPVTASEMVIERELCDRLRAAAFLELSSSAEDLDSALSYGGTEAMLAARTRSEDAARLLDDLGWAEDPARQKFAITLPVDRLKRLLGRIDRATQNALTGYAQMLRSTPAVEGTPAEHQDRLDAIREFADQDLDMRSAALALRTALERNAA
jgi:hypothetical protein